MEKQPFKLQDKADNEPFKVPEGFFDDFEATLAKRIDALESHKETTSKTSDEERPVVDITWREKLRPYLYFAAMFVLMFFAIKGIVNMRDNQKQELAMQELDVEEVSTEEVTAEDILMSELDSYNLMYYLYGEDENE